MAHDRKRKKLRDKFYRGAAPKREAMKAYVHPSLRTTKTKKEGG